VPLEHNVSVTFSRLFPNRGTPGVSTFSTLADPFGCPPGVFLSSSVRFLDNFSAGTRGAASAEHFLRSGRYAVIFLHRQFSLQPFSRHYSHSTNPFLDLLEIEGDSEERIVEEFKNERRNGDGDTGGSSSSSAAAASGSGLEHPLFPALPVRRSGREGGDAPTICVSQPNAAPMGDLLRSYKLVKGLGLLHTISFVTVHEYLFLLKGVSEILGGVGRKAMYYLAAAVSDFFIPQQKMVSPIVSVGGREREADLSWLFSLSRNTRYSLGRDRWSSKWIRYRK
jgi:phosphopantothenate-cysteine ligase